MISILGLSHLPFSINLKIDKFDNVLLTGPATGASAAPTQIKFSSIEIRNLTVSQRVKFYTVRCVGKNIRTPRT